MGRLLVLVPLLWATGVEPAAAQAWQSTGPFKIVEATDRCVATTAFKRGNEILVVALEDNPTTDDYAMRLSAPGDLRGRPWDQGKYSLGTAGIEDDLAVAKPSNRAGIVIYEMGMQRRELSSAGPRADVIFREMLDPGPLAIAGLDSVIPLTDACSADLLERWGYSKKFQNELASWPKSKKNMAHYASPYDYPTSARAARAEGDTYALVDVGIDGRASNCRVIRSSGNQSIDNATCMIITKRARYNPAQTRNGERVVAPLYVTFRWEIPRR